MIDAREREKLYSSALMCPVYGMSFEELQPRMFSFNSPFGACEECKGLGVKIEFDPDLIIPDKSLSIIDGAIDIYGKLDLSWRGQQLAVVGKVHGFDLFTPIEKFSKKQLDILLYGDPTPINAKWSSGASMVYKNGWEGLIPQSDRLYLQTESEYRKNDLQKFMKTRECPKCKGKRLKDKVLSVRVAEKSITDITDLSVVKALDFFNNVNISEKEKEISVLF